MSTCSTTDASAAAGSLDAFERHPLVFGPSPVHRLDRLSRILGADVGLVEAGFGIGFKESWEGAIRDIEAYGGQPYAIPAGASDHPLGGQPALNGYAGLFA